MKFWSESEMKFSTMLEEKSTVYGQMPRLMVGLWSCAKSFFAILSLPKTPFTCSFQVSIFNTTHVNFVAKGAYSTLWRWVQLTPKRKHLQDGKKNIKLYYTFPRVYANCFFKGSISIFFKSISMRIINHMKFYHSLCKNKYSGVLAAFSHDGFKIYLHM